MAPILATRPPSDDAPDVESAVACALHAAAEAGRFDVVAQLAKELEARRLFRLGNVISMSGKARLVRE